MAHEISPEGNRHDRPGAVRGQDVDTGVDTAEVQALLDALARAVTAGDGQKVAALWEVPALVIGADAVIAVNARAEVERFFGGARAQYNDQGIVDTRADIMRLEWLNGRIAMVSVRWPYIDQQGRERGAEQSTYTLRRDDDGVLKIRAVTMHGVTERH
jgi:ketosteroid isomerase-like protein